MTVRSIFNEESDYSEEIKSGNEDFRSTILQTFQFGREQEKKCGNESHEKKKYVIKLLCFSCLLSYILGLEISIGANVDIAKMRLEKWIVFVVERHTQCLLLRPKFQCAREARQHSTFTQLPNY